MNEHKLKEGTFTGETINSKSTNDYILSVTRHDSNVKVAKHSHVHPYISLLLNGCYSEKSNVSEQNLATGESLFRPANYEHKNEIGVLQSLCFNLEIKNTLFKDEFLNIDKSYMKFEHNNLEIFKIYLAYKQAFSKESLRLAVDENLYILFGRGKINTKTQNKSWVKEVKQRVRFHPEQQYTINQVANDLNMHPIYFAGKFKKLTGCTFGEFLNRQRLSKAIDLINHSSKKLTCIALESGFYDQSHFIRRFKETFNITPSNYIQIVKS